MKYSIVDLGTADGNWSSAVNINEQGQIVLEIGTTNDPLSSLVRDQRFLLWRDGATTDLTSLDAGRQEEVRQRCLERLGPGPFALESRAWTARGHV